MGTPLRGTGGRRQCAAAALLLALATAPLAHAASKCYFPSGDEATDLVPCDPDAAISMCCRTRDACLSSGLCLRGDTGEDSGYSYERGGCTNQWWNSSVCPQHCLTNRLPPPGPDMAPIYNIENTVALVWQCAGQGYRKALGEYCCENEADKEEKYCCAKKTDVRFTVPAATIGNALAIQTQKALPTARPAVDTTESTGPTPSITTSSTDTAKISEPSSETALTSGSDRPSPSEPTANAQPGETEDAGPGRSGPDDALKIGMGVGIGVGGAIVISTAILVWYRMRARAAAGATAAAEPTRSAYSGGFAYKPELAGDTSRSELWDTDMLRAGAPTELPGESRPVELYSGSGSQDR